jgi:hypothetical protein
MNPKARVTRDIVDLVAPYLHRRQQDIDALRVALQTEDPNRLRVLGQRMRAVGDPYGFTQITTLGRQIVEASDGAEFDLVRSLIEQYEQYLRSVEIVHVEVPTPTWQDVPLVLPQADLPAAPGSDPGH